MTVTDGVGIGGTRTDEAGGDGDVDAVLLAELVRAVEAVPLVDRAAAVVRREVRAGSVHGSRRPVPSRRRDPAPVPDEEGPPAEASGGEYRPRTQDPATLQDALRMAAERAPDKGVVYLSADGAEHVQRYPELLDDAQRALTGLRSSGLRPGEPVLFQFFDNRSFLVAFWACVLGGFVPTPVGTPPGYDRENAVTRKLRNAWDLLDHPLILTDERLLPTTRGLSVLWDVEGLRLESLQALSTGPGSTDWFPARPDDPVLHLLTSGSTGRPKVVRHASCSIIARTVGNAVANGFTAEDVSLNWMPLDHVGGIVMSTVSAVVLRHQHVNAETEAFLADPPSWMEWADRYRVTTTWAPNFAFSLFNEHAGELAGRSWDLSGLRYVLNGGEAVVSRTAQRFSRLLRPFGLPADAVRPAYGMSETSSGITCSALSAADETVGTIRIDNESLSGRLREARPDDPHAVSFTEVGRPLPGVRMRIVDPDDVVLPEDHVGRLQVTGPTIMTGYHRNDDANRASFTVDNWFSTGDLAFLHHGRLTITGRENDRIIIQGANFLSGDIEAIVEQVPGTEVTFVAACAYADAGSDTDRLVVFFVPTSDRAPDRRSVVVEIKARLAREIGLRPHHTVPVSRERFPKTASGKIQRSQLVDALRAGEFDDALSELADADEPEGTLPAWFFDRVWLPAEPGAPAAPPGGVWVLFSATEDDLPERLVAHGADVVVVRPGERFARRGGRTFEVAADDQGELGRLLDVVRQEFGPIGAVVHGWGLRRGEGPLEDQLRAGVFSVRPLLREIAARPGESPALLVLTEGGVWAREGDRVDVAKATLPGLVRTAVAEQVSDRLLMVDVCAEDRSRRVAIVRDELARAGGADVVAYRDGVRLVPRLRPVHLEDGRRPALVPGGLYLVTGGLGGLGGEIAQHLLAAYQVRLLLVGRSEVDPRGRDDRAARLAELQTLGAVEYRSLDVADGPALSCAVSAAEERWGPLAGVLHLAGSDVSGQWRELERHTVAHEPTAAFTAAYRAKVFGTMALAEVLENRPDALLVLFSSVNGDFGGSSFGAYSSANSFLGGFADHWGRERGRPVRCLAWSAWAGVGMNRGSPTAAATARGFRVIDPEHGLESLLYALATDRVHLLIGLDGRNEYIVRELAPEQLRNSEVVVAYCAAEEVPPVRLRTALAEAVRRSPVPVRFLRMAQIPTSADGAVDARWLLAAAVDQPGGRRGHVEPATDLERQLARLWGEVLGQTAVGRDDLFFDLGGSSLLAARLVVRTNRALGTRILVHQLYEHPTVGELADVLDKEPTAGGVRA